MCKHYLGNVCFNNPQREARVVRCLSHRDRPGQRGVVDHDQTATRREGARKKNKKKKNRDNVPLFAIQGGTVEVRTIPQEMQSGVEISIALTKREHGAVRPRGVGKMMTTKCKPRTPKHLFFHPQQQWLGNLPEVAKRPADIESDTMTGRKTLHWTEMRLFPALGIRLPGIYHGPLLPKRRAEGYVDH